MAEGIWSYGFWGWDVSDVLSISEGDGEYCALSFHRIHLIRWLLLSSYVDGIDRAEYLGRCSSFSEPSR